VLTFLRRLHERGKHAPSEPEQSLSSSARTGTAGEDAGAAMLREMDWKILARNWRSGHLELDIVAEDHDTLVFVEVKTRASGGMQRPYEALTAAKKKRLIRAAQAWQAAHDAWSRPCRFDLICVTVGADSCQMELIRNVIEYGEQNPRHTVGGGHSSWQPW